MAESNVRGAWYQYFREEVCKVCNFLQYTNTQKKENFPPKETFGNFRRESLSTFIFESNNLEREGLPLGETRALVFEELQNLPAFHESPDGLADLASFDSVKSALSGDIKAFARFADNQSISDIGAYQNSLADAKIHVVYKSKTKEARTVSQYVLACVEAEQRVSAVIQNEMQAMMYWIAQVSKRFDESNVESSPDFQAVIKEAEEEFPLPSKMTSRLDEELIKRLHTTMASGLIDPHLAPAGEYRNHSVSTDFESHYPSPSDVPKAMTLFIKQFQEKEKSFPNPVVLAAWASTQFVLIHPFSDFNGRMSRLIANIVLRSYHVPFWTSLRSTKKDRNRYLTALRHYRRDRPRSISTLIAKQVNQNIQDFNGVIALSGYPPITPDTMFDDLSDDELESVHMLPLWLVLQRLAQGDISPIESVILASRGWELPKNNSRQD